MDSVTSTIVGGIIGLASGIVASRAQHRWSEHSRLADELRLRYANWIAAARLMTRQIGNRPSFSIVALRSGNLNNNPRAEAIRNAEEVLGREAAQLELIETSDQWRERIQDLTRKGLRTTQEALDEDGKGAWSQFAQDVEQLTADLREHHPVLARQAGEEW